MTIRRHASFSPAATPWDSARPIAFMHIPKAAGTALRLGLERAVAPRRSVVGYCREHFGAFDRFDTMSPDVRSRVFLTPDAVPVGADFIHGHISDSFLRHAYPGAQFVTLLREPRARLLSLWAFCRTQPDAFLASWGAWADRIRRAHAPLRMFLTDPTLASITDNVAVRMIAGPHRLIPNDAVIAPGADATLIEQAIVRLRCYAFVDLVEDPAAADNLTRWIGRSAALPRVNETPAMPDAMRTPLKRELDPETLGLMAERSRLDRALWQAVARHRIPDGDPAGLADAAFGATVARHAVLFSGSR